MSVTIYTKNHCPKCRMTKLQFDRAGIDYDEINLDEHPEYLDSLKSQGFRSAPIVITDNESWSDFRIDKIRMTINHMQTI